MIPERLKELVKKKYQKPINIIEDVNFHLLTKINIRGLDEKDKSLVSGCCFMSGGEIVLIDGIKVKLLDSSFTLKDVLRMQRCPSGVAVLDNATAVVTAGVQIQVIHVLPSLKKGRSISADKYCEGIDIAADQIYVCCCTPGKEDGEICIYDFELNLKKRIGKKLFSYMFKWPKSVSVNRSGQIFVLDGLTVKCLAEDGKIYYKFRELAMPTGLYADDVGDLIVCDRQANAIKIIYDNGTAKRLVLSFLDGINEPQCVAYRPKDGTLVVGCWESDFLLVYKAS